MPRHRRLVDMQLLRVLFCPGPVPYPLLLCPGICRCRHGVVVAGRNIKFLVIYTGQTEAGNISAAVHVARGVCMCVGMRVYVSRVTHSGYPTKGSVLVAGKVS